jgi:hypothetical protein
VEGGGSLEPISELLALVRVLHPSVLLRKEAQHATNLRDGKMTASNSSVALTPLLFAFA